MTARKGCALAAAVLGAVCIASCLFFQILPVSPPRELEKVEHGMTIEEVIAVFGRQPDRQDVDHDNWRFWSVPDGIVSIHFDERARLDMATFHASRSSLYEEIRATVAFLRRFVF